MHSSKPIRIIIAGGGTGGHLYPGIALAQEFQKNWHTEIMFIGTAYGIENKVLPKLPYQFKKIWIRGLQRKLSFMNILFPLRLIVSLFQCAIIFSMFRPDVIIGTGGYVSGPALMIGIALRVPTVIQEQNSYPGLVNRFLGKRVNQVHVTFQDSLPYFKKQKNTFVSGNPVRGELNNFDKKRALAKFNLQENKTTLFIFGGSQGAHAINQVILQSLSKLLAMNELQMIWATGSKDWETVSSKCQDTQGRISIHSYIDDMAAAYAAADFVLCRSGASTLAEIAICGLPAILVPYPYSAAGHQEFNAKSVEKAGAAITILERDLNENSAVQSISDLLTNSGKRQAMSAAALKLAKPNAAKEITTKIMASMVQSTLRKQFQWRKGL